MSKFSRKAILALITAMSLLAPAGASAATEVGDNCAANNTLGPATIVQISKAPAQPPLTAPAAGVVTKWRLTTEGFGPTVFIEKLKVLRDVASASETDFTVVGESAPQAVVGGLNTFEAQIPVAAGDRFGVFGPPAATTVYCSTGTPGDHMATIPGDLTVGNSAVFFPFGAEAQVPVSATVEPDADGDGFGDETQDKCPQSKSIQVECPPLVLDSVLTPGKTSISINVATSAEAPVTVSGIVTVATPKKKAQKSATKKINLTPTTQTVLAGKVGKFKLNYPAALLSALKSLPSSKSAKATITVEGANAAGAKVAVSSTAKIKGQKKKKKKKKKSG
jgi:hypothetical protein